MEALRPFWRGFAAVALVLALVTGGLAAASVVLGDSADEGCGGG